MDVEYTAISPEEFDIVFTTVKQGLYTHIDTVFGWNDAFQIKRLKSEYEWDWFYWIKVEQKRIGLLCFKPYDHAIHIHFLIIFPDFRKQGFDRLIMQQVCQNTKAQGRKQVTLSSFRCNTGAIAFYHSLGFKVTEIETDFVSMTLELD